MNIRALVSGFMGATASFFAKMALDPKNQMVETSSVNWLLRGVCLLAMILCNALMLGSFLNAMEESGSIAGTALATASNFAVSAIYGFVLWGDECTVQWLCGFSLVVMGAYLLSTVKAENTKEKQT